MLPKGISVWVPDHRGHGQSEGKRGHVLNFVQYLSDLRLSVDLAGEDCPEGMKCCTYEPDPLVHDRVSARFFTEILAAMETVHAQASSLKVPTLLQVAGDDHLVDARSSVQFFEKLDLEDKTLHVYDGRYHEIFNEGEDLRRQVLKDLEDWLEEHLGNEY